MELETAKQVILEALNLAMQKGCFGLIENTNILKAIDTINSLQLLNTPEEENT